MTETTQLKDQLDIEAIRLLRRLLCTVSPVLDGEAFERHASQGLAPLALKARVRHIIDALALSLPESFCQSAAILQQLAEIWPQNSQPTHWGNYAAWPVIDYVSVYGLDEPELALPLLEKLTPLFTAEFAIRPFLQQHFELTYQQLLRWTQHDNEHVRRLASEGSRPRLPWAMQLRQLRADPTPLWPLLEKLKRDASPYVRRSVANNLNDISKDHPQQVIKRCRQWLKLQNKHTDWIVRHGVRTLLKSGVEEVYPLLGYSTKVCVEKLALVLASANVEVGGTLCFSLVLQTAKPEKLLLDYRVGFVRGNGRLGRKVFKWKTVETQAKQLVRLEKSQHFKPLATRKYYPGLHYIEVLMNGEIVARAEFNLLSA